MASLRRARDRWPALVRRRAPQWWHRSDVTVRDLPLGLLLLAVSFLPDAHGTQIGGLPTRPLDALALLLIALQSLPLAVRRRWPAVCLALVSAGFAVDQLRGYHSFAGTALPIALLSVGAHLERHRRTAALVFTLAYVPVAVAFARLDPGEPPSELVTFYLAMVLAWGLGAWLRSTRVADAEHRLRIAEDTRTAERTRIARELHDVVTHHVTAMVVQAEAARYLTASPDRLDQSLTAVTDTGRRAIADLRHLLDLLNPDHGTGHGTDRNTGGAVERATEPRAPSGGRLRTLVEQTRLAGQPVEFTEEGTPAEPAGSAELVAYRVVQESLTNALKYAHGSSTSVRVRHAEREITVEVGTDGSGSGAGSPGGSGRGLAGLRERVDVLGGDFSAGPRPGGGFVVRARIPAGSPS
ncbi:two-component sensor histidine kinase [Streptomyces dioscori]|uniref:histidine kinase n=1 Tax=Streptomyces dioscori TaxID=2109333 RepID=A0A2P8PZE6_9ACTN|nr:histidine kinase [Streptomyces dioscori]PSM39366.1 two-component sensor histidine kinase [Streptomyces dioscori]